LEIVFIVAAILAVVYARRPPAPPAPPATPQVGRYQMVIGSDGDPILLDTATGESWYHAKNSASWFKLGPMRSAP
jgi:hypothetical protein